MHKVIVIVGPTSTGKTDLAVKIAQKINSEIISADSLQVYKEFSICTSKPTNDQMIKVKHHLIGYVSVSEKYSVSRFVEDAKEKIEDISELNKVPIIVGGTGLYIDALLNNFQFQKQEKKINVDISDENLYSELIKVDPISAKNIHPNNFKKLRRSLNFFYEFGFSIYEQKKNTSPSSNYDIFKIGLNFKNRNFLYEKINERVDIMVKNGLLDEINKVRKLNISETASSAIGYKELLPFFDGKDILKNCIENIKKQTRHYAKRQITWFKRCKITNWFFIDDGVNLENIVSKIYELHFDRQI